MYGIIHDDSGRGGSRKLTVVSRRYWAEVQTIPVKFLSLQSKEVPTDVYWVNVKVLGTLILCDHSPQHTNSNGRNVVNVCCSILTN